MEAIAKIKITSKDSEELRKVAGSLQDVANLIASGQADANDVVVLLQKVKQNPDLIKTALNFL